MHLELILIAIQCEVSFRASANVGNKPESEVTECCRHIRLLSKHGLPTTPKTAEF